MAEAADDMLDVVLAAINKVLGKKAKEAAVNADTSLLHGGVLDSVATLKVVDILEKKYKVEFDPTELSADYLDTPKLMVKLLKKKTK